MPGIWSSSATIDIHVIEVPLSFASVSSSWRSSWIIRPISMFWPRRIERATVAMPGSMSSRLA
jgi:hypothetical protein